MTDPIITVRRAPGRFDRGILSVGALSLPCALGRSGTTIDKREGDGATPVGEMRLLAAFRRPGRGAPLSADLPLFHTVPGRDGWCDEPTHAAYNRYVRLPFEASCESLARADRLYDLVIVLDWNYRSRRRGRGSAIFLHMARPGYPPTAGCVAVVPNDMRRLAPHLHRNMRLRVER